MSEAGERRTLNVARVDLTTLVDICVQDGNLSPFQAESANVSGRGMQVRTSYLPEIGEDLVCRFEHDGTEILVEGRVAWRAEGQDSGEFGIQFTALDASSAEILRGLGQNQQSAGSAARERRALVPRLFALDEEEEAAADDFLGTGARVRLHIDGLAGPMKACVHDGTQRKVRVGSSLEFLKVGRALKIEDVEGGQSRGAHVDSVNVVLNPSTSIPELVVMLRYEGMSPTPPPALAAQKLEGSAAVRERHTAASVFSVPAADYEDEFVDSDSDLPDRLQPAADAIRARLETAFASASRVAGEAGGALSRVASAARDRVQRLGPKTGLPRTSKLPAQSQRRPTTAPRRTTAPPAHLRSSLADAGVVQRERQDSRSSLRPQARSARAAGVGPEPNRKKRLALLVGVATLALAGSALLLRVLAPGEVAPAPGAAALASQGANAAAAAAVPSAVVTERQTPAAPGGIVADVPLFGPKAMATVEAAPGSAPPLSDAEAEKLAAAALVDDETWAEGSNAGAAPAKATEVAPWGRGKLHLPTIHRVRLDAEGTELAGAVEGSGFTVVVPGRKAMESGRAIEKRDRRIVQAKASNTARGASIHFEFRGPVPAYRVRLRKEFVEFLISAPEDGVAQR